MGVLSFFRQVYDLDTIDTRLTDGEAKAKAAEARNDPGASKDRAAKWSSRAPQLSRWHNPEFVFYMIGMVFSIPYMCYIAYSASKTSNPDYGRYHHLLSPGWIGDRMIDLSDAQYSTFRSNLPYVTLLLVMQPISRRFFNFVRSVRSRNQGPRPPYEEAEARLQLRTSFDFAWSLKFMFLLHGVSAFKIFTILFLNYKLATALPRRYVPLATWVFNVGVLFSNDIFGGYKFENIAGYITGQPVGGFIMSSDTSLVAYGRWLDSYGGIMSRWHILFNITVLRLISFNLDYYWSYDKKNTSPIDKQLDPANLSERDRVSIPAQPKDYSFRNYIAFALYAPLYLTGPIMTFNDYISQCRYKSSSIQLGRTVRYGVRFLLCLLCMEITLHYVYVQAIAKAHPVWDYYTTAQLGLLSYFNLALIWMKLLLPWRLFRLWALIDGIDPPENMVRCVTNNQSTLSFWRSWHRSFYRWSLRYIYIPLGGSSFRDLPSIGRSLLTYVLVFTFVALWHDIKMNLLAWGWLIVLFMVPEMAAKAFFPPRKFESSPTTYRVLAGLGGVGNQFMMMAANLVGFAFGLDGLANILTGILRDLSGLSFILSATFVLFMANQLMFELRDAELKRGINLKC